MKLSILFGTLVAVLCVAGVLFFVTQTHVEAPITACTQEAKQCPDGSYVGRTGPRCEFAPCHQATTTTPAELSPIVVTAPQNTAFVKSPVSVSGKAQGSWFFEGSAPVVVVNAQGTVVGTGHITAGGDWMTTDFVPFTGTISYTLPPGTTQNYGTMIFKKDNPSGLPEYGASKEIPIIFSELTPEGGAVTDPGLGEENPHLP